MIVKVISGEMIRNQGLISCSFGIMPIIQVKRIYDAPEITDGYRILIDRLWPRGISKKEAQLDDWAKEIAPSPALRKWFGHKEENWKAFENEYREELEKNKSFNDFVDLHKDKKRLTLLFATRNQKFTHALIIKAILEKKYHAR